MPSQNARTAMLMGGALLAAIGGASFDSKPASAEEPLLQPLASESQLISGVNFVDEHAAALHRPQGPSLMLSADEDQARFTNLNQFASEPAPEQNRAVEFELAAPHNVTGIPLDVSIAQRASFGADDSGDINRHSRGSEVRIGRALGDPRTSGGRADSRIYVFAASDDEALTWQPGAENRFAFQQDRVEIGDMQAGVTYERGPMQASLAYVEREVSATVGRTTFNNDENFAGFTLTMRR
jgi:hypothetical protein